MIETLGRTISSNELENTHKRLCRELKCAIDELQNNGFYTNYIPMCRQIELFVNVIFALPGGRDKLSERAIRTLQVCGKGSEYQFVRSKALSSYMGDTKELVGMNGAMRRLHNDTEQPMRPAEIQNARSDIKGVLSDPSLKLTSESKQNFQHWYDVCVKIQARDNLDNLDGCWYLYYIHKVSEGYPTEQEKWAEEITQEKLDDRKLEEILFAVNFIYGEVTELGPKDGESELGFQQNQQKMHRRLPAPRNRSSHLAGGNPKRLGRPGPDDETVQKEAQLAADWARERDNKVYKPDFAKERNMTQKDLNKLLDRVAKRKLRSD